MVGFVLMCILYACYAADVVVTAFAASDLARELDAWKGGRQYARRVRCHDRAAGYHRHGCGPEDGREPPAVQAGSRRGPGQCRQTEPPGCRCRPARQGRRGHGSAATSSQEARLNASEAAAAVKLAAKGTAERTAELLRLEQLAEELQARSEEMRARTRSSKYFGKGRMLRAYPKLRHGEKHRSLDELRERLKYERRH